MKKILFLIGILCISFTFSGCKKQKFFVPLGNFSSSLIENIEKRTNNQAKNYFTSSKMSSGELFKIADSNATYVDEDHKYTFINTIERASTIMIAIGLMDILPSLTIDEKESILDYDYELVEHQLEILDYHLVHIIDEIRYVTSKSKIMLIGTFSTYIFEKPEKALFDSIITRINRILLEACSDNKMEYVSLLSIEEKKDDDDFKKNIDSYAAEIIATHYE